MATGATSNLLGYSVAISGDGNTIVAGSIGSGAWVFTRTGSVWSQQARLVGTGRQSTSGTASYMGQTVAISADGNTIAVGDDTDANTTGATWIFTRNGGVWSQQGSKLVGTGGSGLVVQSMALALSADGNTLLIGGPGDSNYSGSVWCFTRTAGVWTQFGNKIRQPEFSAVPAVFGSGVSLSRDGNIAVVAGSATNNSSHGVLWDFRRVGGEWIQQGPSFTGSGRAGSSVLCCALAISANGDTVLLGAATDNGLAGDLGVGAAWTFARRTLRITAPASVVAGVPFPVRIQAVLPNNIVDPTPNGKINLSSSDLHASMSDVTTFSEDGATYQITLQVPGQQTISATYFPDPRIVGTTTITVRPAAVQVSPTSLTLTGTGGESSTGAGANLAVTADVAISFTAAAANSWIQLSPTMGTTPANLSVRVNPTGLTPGSYNGSITLTFADGGTVAVPVTVTVAPPVRIAAFTNAASFLQGSAAPNTLITAFGSFPGCESDPRVSIDGRPATVFGGASTQITFLVPATVAGRQSANVEVACAGFVSAPVALAITDATPALFTASQTGAGQVAIVNQDGSVGAPSPHGTVVTVYGTGFGVMTQGQDGLAHVLLPVTASIGGRPAVVVYAGEAPGFTSGLQQINVLIPADAPTGAEVPLVLTARPGATTQAGGTVMLQ